MPTKIVVPTIVLLTLIMGLIIGYQYGEIKKLKQSADTALEVVSTEVHGSNRWDGTTLRLQSGATIWVGPDDTLDGARLRITDKTGKRRYDGASGYPYSK